MAFLCALLLSLTCQGQDLELLIEGAKLNDSLVRSGMGHIVITEHRTPLWKKVLYEGEDPTKIVESGDTKRMFYAFEGPKIRCDIEEVLIFKGKTSLYRDDDEHSIVRVPLYALAR